jgi:2-polyprenyl-3-methyl-5-hydroxy-6-metoxy-1,4-benzoquinol methylase
MNLNFVRTITQKTGIYYRLANLYANLVVKPKYKKIEKVNRVEFEAIKSNATNVLDQAVASQVTNALPNSGGIPVEVEKINVETLNSNIIKNESRKTGVQSFEGMALNDAIATEDWKHYSFLPLAKTVAEIAKKNAGKETFSILELGCGAGSMFEYFRIMGASLYIGLEGNPLAFKYSPVLSKNQDFFRLVNLQEEVNFNRRFDLIYTSEVLEHINEDKTDMFLKTIANHMDKDSLFLGTIAFTVMDVHINVHDKKWWLEKFSKQGLFPFEGSATLENKLAENNPYNWNRNTSHIFALKKN